MASQAFYVLVSVMVLLSAIVVSGMNFTSFTDIICCICNAISIYCLKSLDLTGIVCVTMKIYRFEEV